LQVGAAKLTVSLFRCMFTIAAAAAAYV